MYITFQETCVCTCMLYKYNSHILVSNEVYIVCVNVHVSQKSHLAPEIHCNFCLLNTLYSKVYVNLCINPVLLISSLIIVFQRSRIYICDSKTTLVAHNNFEQTLTFKHLVFGHFGQEPMKCGIQEEQLMFLLDTTFHWLPI